MQTTPDRCCRWVKASVCWSEYRTLRRAAAEMIGFCSEGAVRRLRALLIGCLTLMGGRSDALLLCIQFAAHAGLRCS